MEKFLDILLMGSTICLDNDCIAYAFGCVSIKKQKNINNMEHNN